MVSDSVLEAVLRSGVSLPAPSQSFLRLQATAANPRSGARELAAIAVKDPVLVGALTRVANSPALYTRGPARTVVDVIAMLGATKTLAIAMTSSLRIRIPGVDPRIIDAIWDRSVHVAARALHATRRSRQPALGDLAYFAALVHDAGICVLLRRYPERAALFGDAPASGIDAAACALDAACGSEHAAVGCIVARNWKLSPVVSEAIRLHHAPDAPATADAEAAAIAALIAVGRRVIDGPSDEWARWEPVVLERLGLDAPMLEAMAAAELRPSPSRADG